MCPKSYVIYLILLSAMIGMATTITLRGVTVEVMPYLYIQNNTFRGYCVDVMDEISRITNLNYSLYLDPNNLHGAVSQQPPVRGMIHQIYFNTTTDFGIADLTVTENRKRFVDFTSPIMKLGISALIHNTNAEFIQFFRNLAKQNRVAYGVARRSQLLQKYHDISQNANDETIRLMYHKMMKNDGLVDDKVEGIRRAKLESYAFIQESANNEFIAAHDCELQSLRDYSGKFESQYAIALPKGSPYMAKFNFAIRQMEENKFFDKLKHKYWKSVCNSGHSHLTSNSLLLAITSTFLSIMLTCSISTNCFIQMY